MACRFGPFPTRRAGCMGKGETTSCTCAFLTVAAPRFAAEMMPTITRWRGTRNTNGTCAGAVRRSRERRMTHMINSAWQRQAGEGAGRSAASRTGEAPPRGSASGAPRGAAAPVLRKNCVPLVQEPTNTRDAPHRAALCSAPIRSQPGYGETSASTSIRSLEDLARRDPAPCAGVLDCSGRSRISVQAADGLPTVE